MEDGIYFILSCNCILVTRLGCRFFVGVPELYLRGCSSVIQLLEGGCQSLHHLGLSLLLRVQVPRVFCPLQRRFGIAAQIFSEYADTNVVRQACRCRLANMAVIGREKKKKEKLNN